MKTYTLEEQAENRRKWVEALRDPLKKQAFGRIRLYGGKMCCLGVATEVIGADLYEDDGFVGNYIEVEKAMGMKSWGDFVDMNDSRHLSFPQIADAIESRPELFVQGEGK